MNNSISTLLKYFSAILILFFAMSCKKAISDKCSSIEQGGVMKIEGVNQTNKNQRTELKVTFGTYNSCGVFDHFDEMTNGNTTQIKIYLNYNQCEGCFQVAEPKQTTYNFKERKSGVYYLEFVNSNGNSIFDTISVN